MLDQPRARTSEVRVSRNPDGGLLVYDVRRDAGHVLSPSVGMVYQLADGTRSVQDIAARLPDLVGLPADEEIVNLALEQLHEAELLDTELPEPARPGLSRRDLITRLALTAGAVALLPSLDSISELSRATAMPASSLGTTSSTVDPAGQYYT